MEIYDGNEEDNEFDWVEQYEDENISSDFDYDSQDEELDDQIVRSKMTGEHFDNRVSMAEVTFRKSMIFKSWNEFKFALKDYKIANNYPLYYKVNDDIRCEEEGDCPFRLWASKAGGDSAIQIKTLYDEHNCDKKFTNPNGGAKWMCNKIIGIVRHNMRIKPKDIIAWFLERYGFHINATQAYRARKKAREIIEVDMVLQYGRLRDYGAEILRTNQNSTVIISCERDKEDDPAVFNRMYICLEALKSGFLTGCRPFIGLDGSFLKTSCGGQLLTAMGQDGNNGIFPIAWAVVESESADTWLWFLQLLMDDLGGWDRRGRFMFMSDQQKGLMQVFNDNFEGIEHRLCVRHFHANFKKQYPGDTLKKQFWACAYAQTIPEKEIEIENLTKINKGAAEWLAITNPRLRCRAHFEVICKNWNLTNNISESYNSKIRLYREKNIISLFEELRMEAMRRITTNRGRMERHDGKFVPRIQSKLKSDMALAGPWQAIWSGDRDILIFQVTKPPEAHDVNLGRQTCSCRFWDLNGIPCVHAMAAIGFKKLAIDDYVSHYYTKETYLRCYGGVVYPVPSMNLWPRTEEEEILPPPKPKKRGRPKVNRRKEHGENRSSIKIRRVYPKVTCGRCLKDGHNRRSCKTTPEDVATALKAQADKKKTRKKRTPSHHVARDVDGDALLDDAGGPSTSRKKPRRKKSTREPVAEQAHTVNDNAENYDIEHDAYLYELMEGAKRELLQCNPQSLQGRSGTSEIESSIEAPADKILGTQTAVFKKAVNNNQPKKLPVKKTFKPPKSFNLSTRVAASSASRVDKLLEASKK